MSEDRKEAELSAMRGEAAYRAAVEQATVGDMIDGMALRIAMALIVSDIVECSERTDCAEDVAADVLALVEHCETDDGSDVP